MSYQLLLMDMDSTLINEEGIDLLAQFAGLDSEVAHLTSLAMAGEMDFYQSLRKRVSLLAGKPTELIEKVKSSLSFTAGASTLISTLKERGWRIGVVSGGFHEIIDELLNPLQLDFVRANRFEVINGTFTGQVIDPIIGPHEKESALVEFAEKWQIDLAESVAIGDGANDRFMIERAGLGVAFCAKPVLQGIADLSINVRDLSKLLEVV